MTVRNLYSKRRAPLPDVFRYDDLPEKLRVQIVHVMAAAEAVVWNGWAGIADATAEEHGIIALPNARQFYSGYRGRERDCRADCLKYVLEAPTEHVLDLLEVAFEFFGAGRKTSAVDTINTRFRENGIGYQLENGQIVRVDSQLLHAEITKPALAFLAAPGFEGPNGEFLSAHEHMRHGRVEEAITDACKAFESTMKAICTARKWKVDPKAAAKDLIKAVLDNGLVPISSGEQLENVLKVLMLGLATLRNKNAGHGAGATPRDVPEHFAAYALHLAASNIVFLVESHKAKK